MKKIALIALFTLTACSTPDVQQSSRKTSIAQEEDYVTGSHIPHRSSSQPIQALDKQQVGDIQRQLSPLSVPSSSSSR
ncbi:hypothetical protein H8K32_17845 [Undibacterium jejuense]|uniref:Lipoprotein n=1 Tax=Undibacterium jejuense TaxID=1344949 RepID=A0A923HK88_9BURK|nr:hypothetical protein [Undibacterium jejuense]MBC3863973.1 hypothetical protein [Undibacterium jejuense]